MAFTSKLGTSDSRLGNIQLGSGGVLSGDYEDNLTIAGTSAVSTTSNDNFFNTLTISGTSASSMLEGFRYQLTRQIDATASLSGVNSLGVSNSISIDGTADIDLDFTYLQYQSVTLAGSCELDVEIIHNKFLTLTVSGSSAFNSPGGLVHNIQRSIEGAASITVLDGFLYTRDLDIDGTANIAVNFLYVMNHSLSIAGTCDIAFTGDFSLLNSLTIAGTADFDTTTDGVWYESIGIFGTCRIFIENIYDVLLVSAVLASFTATVTKTAQGQPSTDATGAFNATAQCVFLRPVTQTLTLSQAVVVKKPTAFVTQTLAMTQQATFLKVHSRAVTQTLSMTQEAVAVRSINQTLTFSHFATCVRVQNRSVSQTLALTHSVARTSVISRSLSHTLAFNPLNLQRLPLIGSQNQLQNRQFEYYVPTVSAVLVPRQCLIILGVPSQTILLPCPIFGDSQSYQGEINLKRSMTGVTYTYVKKARTQKLKYSFEVWTNKYLELRQFVLAHNSELMTLQNHNAETWLVFLSNNPIEFTTESRWQPLGEKYNVTLEFEGVKIAG